MNKERLIADFKSGDLKIEASKLDDMKVQVCGNATVVTYGSTDKGIYKGKDISGNTVGRMYSLSAMVAGRLLLGKGLVSASNNARPLTAAG